MDSSFWFDTSNFGTLRDKDRNGTEHSQIFVQDKKGHLKSGWGPNEKGILNDIRFQLIEIGRKNSLSSRPLLWIVHCTYLGLSGYDFKKNIVFFCLKIFLPLQTV